MIKATLLTLSLSMFASAAQLWQFSTIPADGVIAAVAGQAAGWGYRLVNDSPNMWLVPYSVVGDPVEHGQLILLFDFPILSPHSQTEQSYAGGFGLYEIVWDDDAPMKFVSAGSFVIAADWYSGDPLNGGGFLGSAGERPAAYSATVTRAVPEPAAWVLVLAGVVAVVAMGQSGRK